MELYQLKAFAAVAEHGNMTRAAEALFTSQPAVSAQIKALEQSFGIALFTRGPAGMALTEPGKKLLDQARQTLAAARATKDLARRLRGNPAGSLRIGLNDAGPRLRVDRLTRALLADQPDLALHFDHGTSGSVLSSLRAYQIDVGFYEGPINDPNLAITALGHVELCIVLPLHWASELPDREDWAPLCALPWVFTSPDCSYHAELDRLTDRHRLSVNKQFRLDHDSVSLHLVRQGLAVSMVDREFAQSYADAGELAIWPYYTGSIPFCALHLKKRQAEPALAAFRAAVNQVFRDLADPVSA